MFSENHPIQKQMFFLGANQDEDPNIVFSKENSGEYIDAHNMEHTSNDGKTGSLNTILGEEEKWTTVGYGSYKCTGSIAVNNYVFEIWAPQTAGQPGIIRINGQIALNSVNFVIDQDHHFQIDKSDSDFNEVFITDNNGKPPFLFDVKDMFDSIGTTKYTTAFDPSAYQINVQSALDSVAFIGLKNVGGSGGGPVGMYQYQIRYSSNSGDVTNWSHPTPMIAIPQNYSNDSDIYPYTKTYGSVPNPESLSSFAPHLRFRVTNLYDYDFIEVKRIAYNQGAGLNFTPNGTVVFRRAVSPGEISVVDYIDFQDSNTSISVDVQDDVKQLAHIVAAGSIRYMDRRLVLGDIEVASKESNPTFLEVNEKTGWPVIENMGKSGHKDPWYHTYRRSEMHGDKAGFGVQFYDCVGNKGFVSPITGMENYAIPNRRDPIASETEDFSLTGVVTAATTATRTVDKTHEVFDLSNAVSKTNKCDFKNIIQKGRTLGTTGTKLKTEIVNPSGGVVFDCDETNAEIQQHAALVSAVGGLVSTAYLPLHPTSSSDPDVTGHNYMVNNKVSTDNIFTGSIANEDDNVHDYMPKGFAPNYYSTGVMIAGVDDIPSWAKSFAVVRTPTAGRVVCQGIGFYSLLEARFNAIGNDNLGGKETKKFWFYAPDIEHGIVPSSTVNDIIQNPQNYKVQFVSPLGFFSEWYSAEDNLITKQRDRCIDMITYARMIRDNSASPTINPAEDSSFGIDGGDSNRYVDYELFRNTTQNSTAFSGSAEKGNTLFDIQSLSRKAEGRGDFLEMSVYSDIYSKVYPGAVGETNFEKQGNKDWTEPLYIVNIVKTGVEIKDNEVQKYKPTSHYQKLESIIGRSNGQLNQSFPLVDERWEDCISAPRQGMFGDSIDRFIYIKKPDGSVDKWLNVTYMSITTVNSIVNAISFSGSYTGGIKGVYTHTNIDQQGRFFTIDFNRMAPDEDSLILVRYDKTAPIRVYGGDTYIGEAIFSPIDRRASANEEADNMFAFGNGLPYKTFKLNPRYYTIRKSGASSNEIQDQPWFTLGYIRQLCVMFTVESRSALHLAYSADYPNQFFPQINYVMRPNRFEYDKELVDQHVYTEYGDDYPGEITQWGWGGFRFKQQVNPDYAIDAPVAFASKPEFGYVERTKFPNMAMWTLRRPLNVKLPQGLKTFPANNSFEIEDRNGKINYLWVDTTEKGDNLYALTEAGVCILLTKKSTLTDLNGGNIGYMATTDSFIGQEYWLSRSIGVKGKLWYSIADAFIPTTLEDGSEVINRALFFANNESVYRLMNNIIVDIGRIKYYSRLHPVLKELNTDFLAAGYDAYKRQYYLRTENETFAFSQKNQRWIGTNSFSADKFTTHGTTMYSHHEMSTRELNKGHLIGGENISGYVTICHAPNGTKDKEFIRTRIMCNVAPENVEYRYEKNGIVICSVNGIDWYYYGGYEQFIPRVDASVDTETPRFQNPLIFTKIFFNLAEDFKITDCDIQFKEIRK